MLERDIHFRHPTVDIAMANLENFLRDAKRTHERIIKIVVGYGSTGGTHRIKTASIKFLDELKESKRIKEYICGNELDIFGTKYQKFPYQALIPENEKFEKNPGIILIIL